MTTAKLFGNRLIGPLGRPVGSDGPGGTGGCTGTLIAGPAGSEVLFSRATGCSSLGRGRLEEGGGGTTGGGGDTGGGTTGGGATGSGGGVGFLTTTSIKMGASFRLAGGTGRR